MHYEHYIRMPGKALRGILKDDHGLVEALMPIDSLERKIIEKVLEEGTLMNLLTADIQRIVAAEMEK